MSFYVDPSQQTPLFTAQQVTCAYPISDFYADCPRYLYYALLVACLLLRWHPWLSDAFLGAAATYAGVAAFESFVMLSGWPKTGVPEVITIPFIDSTTVDGNDTLSELTNLVTDTDMVNVWPRVLEFDIDAVLAIVVTGYLFMLPVHCWSMHIRGHRARHLVMAIWSVLMLSATICGLILWTKIGTFPYQYRFCYPLYPDRDSVQNQGWQDELWQGTWNSTLWNTFANRTANNILSDNCMYPCFNSSFVLRRSQSIVSNTRTDRSPRTNQALTESEAVHQANLAAFMYGAISLSAIVAVILLIMISVGVHRFTTIPLDRPIFLWTARHDIKHSIQHDIKNVFRRRPPKRAKIRADDQQHRQEKAATITTAPEYPPRHQSMLRLLGNLVAVLILLIVVVVVPATWIVFIIWIEWWIHHDLVSEETPRQVGQWAPAASVALVAVSALVMRLKYRIASREEVEGEIEELEMKLRKLERLRDKVS